MIMMTGRVLLVCALCVLWCGVCCGGRAEANSALPDNASSKEKPKNQEEAVGGAGGVPHSGQLAELQPEGVSVQGATGVGTAIQPDAKLSPGAPDAGRRNPDQTQGAEDVVGTDDEQEPKEEEGEDNGIQQEEEEEKEEEKIQQENEKREEESRGEEKKEEEEKRNDKKEEEEEKKEEVVTGTTKGMSAGGQEQPSLSSGTEGASNKTNPKSTQTTGDNDPAADGAGTREEKQNENKEANPKETPVTAAAMKNTTATNGDSDGSTAVSHTTSPPLLLVVLACAAAAAVVAARE
ncbi:mucin-associated surface protein (MASP), putative [Trypanosoma cruzi]|nr:mucin-associated surface protein (MASP), putative [Trypanosoma cruzi]